MQNAMKRGTSRDGWKPTNFQALKADTAQGKGSKKKEGEIMCT